MYRFALAVVLLVSTASAQEPDQPLPEVPTIADEPRAVDPATLVPKPLAQKVTVSFNEAALSEVGDWIRTNADIPVLFDRAPIEAIGVSLSEPVSDSLNDEPLFTLLDRLQSLGLAWYYKNKVIRITSLPAAESRMETVPYPLGDFLDDGYESADLNFLITETLGGRWADNEGEGGTLEFLGDVMFVRQTEEVHRRLRGLLTALRKHARQTYIFDAPQHANLRTALKEDVSVDFDDLPLVEAVAALSKSTGAKIRLDRRELLRLRIRDRQPVSLSLEDRSLETVLEVLLADLKLTWMLRDGILWLTSDSRAKQELLTAVYDVRDLCRTDEESYALQAAIRSQTGGPWMETEGEGGSVAFAKAGTMVVRQTDPIHERVLTLLEAYRTALKNSKQRKQADPDQEVLTRHYSVQSETVLDLIKFMRFWVAPESWQTEEKPDAVGVIRGMIPAGKRLLFPPSKFGKTSAIQSVEVNQVSLVIVQTRAVHREIADLIRRIENGDERPIDPQQMGFGGGGGFGGGFFSVKERHEK